MKQEEKVMTIELSLLISGVSVAFAIFFGISTKNRNTKKDTQEEAAQDAAVMVKLESIQTGMIELKTETRNYREELQKVNEKNIRNEESLKSLHKRVDKVEQMLQLHPHLNE